MVVIITWAPVLWQPTELLKRNVFWAWVTVYCTSTLITAFTTPHKRTHTPACKLQPSRRAVQIWVRVNKALCSQPNMLRRVPPAVRPCLIAAQLFGPPHGPAPPVTQSRLVAPKAVSLSSFPHARVCQHARRCLQSSWIITWASIAAWLVDGMWSKMNAVEKRSTC